MRRIAKISCILSLSAATLTMAEPMGLSVDTIASTIPSSFHFAGFIAQTSDNDQSHGLNSSDLIIIKPANNSDFSLHIGFDASHPSLNQIMPSIAWSPNPNITVEIGSEQMLDTFGDMSLTIGTAFAF